MNFEPKKTDRAAFVALWHNDELLVLQSRKWREEGTPYLLPGGGAKDGESLEECAVRELQEETGLTIASDLPYYFGREDTQWSACHFYEYELRFTHVFNIEPKLFGFEWWSFSKDKARIQVLKPFMMPGLKWYLGQKGLL